jgi:uncharacterized BrkB/YihY/UPF0761 family membrane protein
VADANCAGSLAVILVWIYFTSQLMLLAVAFARQFEPLPATKRVPPPPRLLRWRAASDPR